MRRAFLVDGTGKVEPIQIADDDGVRRYFAKGDDIYGKTLDHKLDNGSVVRVWRTRDTAQDIEVYTGHDRRTLETVDLVDLPTAARVGQEVL